MARPVKFKDHVSVELLKEIEAISKHFGTILDKVENEVGRTNTEYKWARATEVKIRDFYKHLLEYQFRGVPSVSDEKDTQCVMDTQITWGSQFERQELEEIGIYDSLDKAHGLHLRYDDNQ